MLTTTTFDGEGQLLASLDLAPDPGLTLVRPSSGGADLRLEFALSVADGLSRVPPRLDCRYLYDARGSELFERICELPEYYPTRIERELLGRHAREIREAVGPTALLELGAGSASKTGCLLEAWEEADGRATYVPVDVSATALVGAGRSIVASRPTARVVALNASFDEGLLAIPALSPVTVVFLGGTVGNMDGPASDRFWSAVADRLGPEDRFLLGVDLVKERGVLEAAYDDPGGVTAAFTLNLFGRMNRELGAGLDLSAIEHEARWSEARGQIEIHGRFTRPQRLHVSPLERTFDLAAGDRVLVEVSRKFELPALRAYLSGFGLAVTECFRDERCWFALLLIERSRCEVGRG